MIPLKKYCPYCDEMHELKEFSWIGNGMYGRSRVCKKGLNIAAQIKKKAKRKELDFLRLALPV